MTARSNLLSLFLTLATLAVCSAQPYELGWDEINESLPSQGKGYTLNWDSVSRHVAPNLSAPEGLDSVSQAPPEEAVWPRPEPKRHAMLFPQPAPEKQKSYDIQFSSSRYYDVYAERYLQVREVEVETFGRGSYRSQTFENRGCWNTYPVYLKDLREGDRYRVRVIWEDGSNRTIDKVVHSSTGHTVYVGEPDPLAYTAW